MSETKETKGNSFSDYWPLVSLIGVALLGGAAITYGINGGMFHFMHYFMGMFLCSFAMLKIFNPAGFAKGFTMYDIIAKRSRGYALVYPYIELALGLGYLSFFMPFTVYVATVIVMGIGVLGVIRALKDGLDINCPCMGSILNVPLSTVTLAEDIGMMVMALAMIGMALV